MSLLIKHFYRFGEFSIDTDQRVLLRQSKPVALTPKVFDTLLILVENSGEIVTKDELMNRLWPDTFVEEDNLTFNIKQLRKTLNDDARHPIYIETVARRGYRFIASVEEVLSDQSAASSQITQRIEFADNEPAGATLNHSRSTEQVAATPASIGVSTGISRKSLALSVALALLLAVGGFLFWKFVARANPKAGATGSGNSKVALASPLKIEKLTESGQSRQVAISPNGQYVAYTRTSKKAQSIWLRQLATNSNIEIVPARGLVNGLAFANNGESLYFVREDPTTALYRVSVVGGVPTKIVDNLKGAIAISSDDRQIAFVREVSNRDGLRESYLLIVGADGGDERTVFASTYPNSLRAPVWSPDERAIICAYGNAEGGGQDMRLIEVDVADGSLKELSAERFFYISKIAWLPQKSGLLLSANKKLADNVELWRVSYPGIEISQVTEGVATFLDLSVAANADRAVASQTTLNADLWVSPDPEPKNLKRITQARSSFCWTADGRLVFMSNASGNRDLWMMRPDGSEQRQLTSDPAVDAEPCATPDNRYIVFLSNRTNSYQVWRMNLDGSNQTQLTHDDSRKRGLAISPDGQWILYNTADNWQLWRISIDGGEPVRITDYFASHPAVSPDGKMIACVGKGESGRELMIMPFEGGQPLKRLPLPLLQIRIQWTPDGKAVVYDTERNLIQSLIKQPLDGSPPEDILTFEEDELYDFSYSADGNHLALIRGIWQHDIVLISNLNRF